VETTNSNYSSTAHLNQIPRDRIIPIHVCFMNVLIVLYIASVHPGEGSSSVALLKVSALFFPPERVFSIFGIFF